MTPHEWNVRQHDKATRGEPGDAPQYCCESCGTFEDKCEARCQCLKCEAMIEEDC